MIGLSPALRSPHHPQTCDRRPRGPDAQSPVDYCRSLAGTRDDYRFAPWHFLNFFPDPHGHGSFRPTVDQSTLAGAGVANDFVRPAPTITGSFRATGLVAAGGSAGPMSTPPLAPSPLPDDVAAISSSGMSSRMPSALYRFLGRSCCGGGGGGADGSKTSC